MNCPKCNIEFKPGQKFCGGCGANLDKKCPQCGISNPPSFGFCSGCGASLAEVAWCVLNRAGLIVDANDLFFELLGQRREMVLDKPFSLLVKKDKLAFFFTHWNELIGKQKAQKMELPLQPQGHDPIFVEIAYDYDKQLSSRNELVKMTVEDRSGHRLSLEQLAHKENLLKLIFGAAREVAAETAPYAEKSIARVMENICRCADGTQSFLFAFNEEQKSLESVYIWNNRLIKGVDRNNRFVAYAQLGRTLARLLRERVLVYKDVQQLGPVEQGEVEAWQLGPVKGLVCRMLYCKGRPAGIIGVSGPKSFNDRMEDVIEVMNLLGHLIADELLYATRGYQQAGTSIPSLSAIGSNVSVSVKAAAGVSIPHGDDSDTVDLEFIYDDMAAATAGDAAKNGNQSPVIAQLSMKFATDKETPVDKAERVAVQDDGMVKLICPECGFLEYIPPDPFEELGYKLRVTCVCKKGFTVMREQRWFFRKGTSLMGSFKLSDQNGAYQYLGSNWSGMRVIDLSKAGIRFMTVDTHSIRLGQYLLVKFKLNNSNQTMIEKTALVKSINGQHIGCMFVGSNPCDTALGFYLL